MLKVNVLLLVIFVSGAFAECPPHVKLFITAPSRMEALNGSCLQIPCSFELKDPNEFNTEGNIYGVWIKTNSRFGNNPQNVIFNSSGTVTTYPMTITGSLKEKSCTTLFSNLIQAYTDIYFFRVETQPFQATAACQNVSVTIKDSPWKPEIKISGDLKEKNSVTITCSAPTPCPQSPPQLTWNLQHATPSTEESQDGTLTTKIQKTITLSDSHDGRNIICSASYPVDGGKRVETASRIVTLNVKYAPKDTSASISPGSGLVSAGNWVNLTCSSRAKPPISSFTWFKISKHGDVKVSGGDFYSFNVKNASDGGSFYCVAANELGHETSAEVVVTVESEGMNQTSFLLPIVGGIIGIFIIIFISVFFIRRSTRSTSHHTQNVALQETAAAEAQNEEIHYGEIDFSKRSPEAQGKDDSEAQDVVYSQVKVCKAGNDSTHTDDGLDSLYAQVRKK